MPCKSYILETNLNKRFTRQWIETFSQPAQFSKIRNFLGKKYKYYRYTTSVRRYNFLKISKYKIIITPPTFSPLILIIGNKKGIKQKKTYKQKQYDKIYIMNILFVIFKIRNK